MKGYKGFKKGLICRGKQYAENTVFEEDEAAICKRGMHFCENPFDVLDYYDLVNGDGSFNDFAEVEALAQPETDDGRKFCATKLKVGAKLSFAGFIKACVWFVCEKTIRGAPDSKFASDDYAQIGSSGHVARIGSIGDAAQIGSGGDFARIGSSGDVARIASSGNFAKISSGGDEAKIGSGGDEAKIGSGGNYAQIGSSGNYAKIGSGGNYAQIGSSGNFAQIGSSGNFARIGSRGDAAKIGSGGDFARIGSSGDVAQIGSSGDFAMIDSAGKHSVVCCAGHNSAVRAKVGSWITLSEWADCEETGGHIPVCVKTAFVDGERIKEDVFYMLVDGEFKEV